MRQKRLIFFIIGLALLFSFLFFKNPDKIKPGEKAPTLDLLDQEGKGVSLKKYLGKVVLINFWASWCPPCLEEMPSLEVLQNQFKNSDFVLVSVNRDSGNFAKAMQAVERARGLLHFTFPVFYDVPESAAELYGVTALPTSFLVGRKGEILQQMEGGRDWNNPKIFAIIKKALEE